jgi:glycosyltransferase involved in cell wall biosynthesis
MSDLRTKLTMAARQYADISGNVFFRSDVCYVVEPASWVIEDVGRNICRRLMTLRGRVTRTDIGVRNSIVHYGSNHCFFSHKGIARPHPSNKVVVTWYHTAPEDEKWYAHFAEADKRIDLWQTACTLTFDKLVAAGVPREKLVMIHLGVDMDVYTPVDAETKRRLRAAKGIPDDALVIGSFQKDGNGWGEGDTPKLVKGPDVFCDAVERIARKRKVFVVLTGPSRGYVKNRLKAAGIPFLHEYLVHPHDVVGYYRLLDLYLVCSREEGGPQAVGESLSCGVPLVTTRVGQAPDIVTDGKDAVLVDVEDVGAIVRGAERFAEDSVFRAACVRAGREVAKKCEWVTLARQHEEKLYGPLRA